MILLKTSTTVGAEIPDNSEVGLQNAIEVAKCGKVKDMAVSLDITHPYAGDLKVLLVAPSGKEVTLHNREDGSGAFETKTYHCETLEAFKGEEMQGAWTLKAFDFAVRDSGTLNGWELEITAESLAAATVEVGKEIPDDDVIGIESSCEITAEGKIDSLKVNLNITHPYIGDIVAKLIAPSGRGCILQRSEGGSADDIHSTYEGDDVKIFIGEDAKGKWRLQVKDNAVRDTGTLDSWGLEMKLYQDEDLTKIEGVGKKIAELLKAAGVRSFSELATASADDVKAILTAAGPAYNRHNPATWPRQAKMAALGQWDELKTWQDELDGGKEV